MSARDAAAAVRKGELSAEELVQACLERIAETEDRVRAWACLDHEHALSQARALDDQRRRGRAQGPLHGVPVGVKDIFDTSDMPTEDGTPLHRGRRPARDATAVTRLRAAGAVILGKTVTTEFAVYAPGKTRNPHDPERTPGGSSSGSAAAVGAGMVPLALGTQTNGSVIRPASYCGVVGYKPTFGLISRHRVLPLSRRLDHVGVFARSVPDAALLAETLIGFDENDPDTKPTAAFRLPQAADEEPPISPRLAFVKPPGWDEQASEDTQAAFAELVELLGDDAEELVLPEMFSQVLDWHRTVMESDLARSLAREYSVAADELSATLREMIQRGRGHLAVDYNAAAEGQELLNAVLDKLFERCDALVAPAATGEAPLGLESTGNPVFATPWTFCGVPAISLPLLEGEHGLPMGVQLVGPRGDDARLLRTARWLAQHLASAQESGAPAG